MGDMPGKHVTRHPPLAWWLMIAVVAIVITAAWPRAAVQADGGASNLAYVAGTGADDNAVSVIDIAQRKITRTIPVGGTPWGIVLSVDAREAYVTEATGQQVAIIDTATHQVVGTLLTGPAPHAIAIDLVHQDHLYVANSGGNTVTVLAPNNRTILATVTVGQHPAGIAIATTGTSIPDYLDPEVYVANTASDTVSVISTDTNQVVATIAVPGGPQNVVVPSFGSVAYVTTQSGDIDVLGLAQRQFLGTLLHVPGATFGLMDYDGVTGQIYVPEVAQNRVLVLTPASADHLPTEPARTEPLTGGPAAVAITFDGAYGFFAEQATGQVTMFNVPTRQTLATLAVTGAPQSIITGAYPPPVMAEQGIAAPGIIVLVVVVVGGAGIILFIVRAARKGLV